MDKIKSQERTSKGMNTKSTGPQRAHVGPFIASSKLV